MKPSEIVKHLNQHVIGQDDAKKILAVAVYSHFKKTASKESSAVEMVKSNILLIGPTGTGKTLLCETLARILTVPFVTADATSLAQTEYVGEEIEAILQRLIDKADGDLEKAQRGIVFIDEVDKLKSSSAQSRGPSGELCTACLAEDHGRHAGQVEGRCLHRYHADPFHLRRCLRWLAGYPGAHAQFRFYLDI